MKYTEEQKIQLKNKRMGGFTKYDRPKPLVKIVGEYYIIESKIN
jgi:hypothetical protein